MLLLLLRLLLRLLWARRANQTGKADLLPCLFGWLRLLLQLPELLIFILLHRERYVSHLRRDVTLPFCGAKCPVLPRLRVEPTLALCYNDHIMTSYWQCAGQGCFMAAWQHFNPAARAADMTPLTAPCCRANLLAALFGPNSALSKWRGSRSGNM